MAASNPAEPRFAYVAERYPPPVLMQAMATWAFAAGADTLGASIHDYAAMDPRAVPTRSARAINQHWLDELSWRIKMGVAPASTPYDRYVPWLASLYQRIYKPILEGSKKYRLPSYFRVGVDSMERWMADNDLWYVGYDLREQDRIFRHLYATPLRLIVAWATAKGVDLQQEVKTYDDLRRVGEAAEEWAALEEAKKLVDPGSPVIYDFGDGWTVVLLNSSEALAFEGGRQHHCLADYANEDDPIRAYYSLRDPQGRPRVTIEHYLGNDTFEQVKGFANAEPDLDLLKRVAWFRIHGGLHKTLRPFGFLVDDVGDNWAWAAWAEGRLPRLVEEGGAPGMDELENDELLRLLIENDIEHPAELSR